jgi:hypothetical protein
MTADIPYGNHQGNRENDREGVSKQESQTMHFHYARNKKYLCSDADEMSSQQNKGDTPFLIFTFKDCEFFRRQQSLKPSVADNHATIFSTDRIENKIRYKHPDVNG